jgi:hypothetical protein
MSFLFYIILLQSFFLYNCLKLAFVGDQGLGPHSAQVLRMISQWQPDGLILLGDFDYEGEGFVLFLYNLDSKAMK